VAAREAPQVPPEGPVLTVPARQLEPLARSFYARPATVVARELLGRLLVRRQRGLTLVGRIVESEAYAEGDPASHSFRGPTPRNAVMFGPPGQLYVYFTYGMHFCSNVVTGRIGEGCAVLLRAVEPLAGLESMAERRGTSDERLLCAGPGRLTRAFDIGRPENGADLVDGRQMTVGRGRPLRDANVGVSTRVGVNVGAESRWRFFELGSPFVSRRVVGSTPLTG
jgi:DNA-3-methyladenine glycosylase